MRIITGYQGEAHITSADDQNLNMGLMESRGLAVLNVGNKFSASAVGIDTVRIMDGAGYLHGVGFRVPYGTYDDVSIASCTTGYKRIDLICAHYERSELGIESMSWKVIQGTETTGTPVSPSGLDEGEPYQGGDACDEAAYSVLVDGTNSLTITQLFEMPVSAADVQEHLDDVSGCLVKVGHDLLLGIDIPDLAAFTQGSAITASVPTRSGADTFEVYSVGGGCVTIGGIAVNHSGRTFRFWPFNARSSTVSGAKYYFMIAYYKTI